MLLGVALSGVRCDDVASCGVASCVVASCGVALSSVDWRSVMRRNVDMSPASRYRIRSVNLLRIYASRLIGYNLITIHLTSIKSALYSINIIGSVRYNCFSLADKTVFKVVVGSPCFSQARHGGGLGFVVTPNHGSLLSNLMVRQWSVLYATLNS